MRCTFFGHSNTPNEIQPKLEETIINLIKNYNVDNFYVGNHGNFDLMVRNTLKKLKSFYPDITYSVVLAYANSKNIEAGHNAIYPFELKNISPKYAIPKRNLWMIEHSDIVVSYVINSFGGASRFFNIAENKGKLLINLAD